MQNPTLEYFFVQDKENERRLMWAKNTNSLSDRPILHCTQSLQDFDLKKQQFTNFLHKVFWFLLKITPFSLYCFYIGAEKSLFQLIKINSFVFMFMQPWVKNIQLDYIFLVLIFGTLFILTLFDEDA